MTTEEERARKLALLQRWEQARELYNRMLLQKQNADLKAERDNLWMLFPEEVLSGMVGEIERKIAELSGEYNKPVEEQGKPDGMTNRDSRETEKQNNEKNQSWSPYQ